MLTIAIPTYNRNQILAETVRRLLPQLTPQCRLLILDNCSDVPVSETLADVLRDFPGINCKILRNNVNIGGNANILRCFELCGTDWLWVLGDDDIPRPDAISTVFSYITAYPGCLFFSLLFGGEARKEPILTTGLKDFVTRLDSFSGVLFLSASIYKASALKQNLKLGYTYTYSTAPHIATLLMSLGDSGTCCLAGQNIVDQGPPRPVTDQWSLVHSFTGTMTLLDLPWPHTVRQELARQILKTFPPLESVMTQLVLMALKQGTSQSALYFYDQIAARLYYFDRSPIRRAKLFAYRALLIWPRLGFGIIGRVYHASRGKALDVQHLQDPLVRM